MDDAAVEETGEWHEGQTVLTGILYFLGSATQTGFDGMRGSIDH